MKIVVFLDFVFGDCFFFFKYKLKVEESDMNFWLLGKDILKILVVFGNGEVVFINIKVY